MATKKIEFNPLLLSGGPSKTKKNRTPKAAPLINPNILKNKLLKRIKEHKNKEQNELKQSASNEAKTRKQTSSQKAGSSKSYTDEFNDSIEYLEALSKKTKESDPDKALKHCLHALVSLGFDRSFRANLIEVRHATFQSTNSFHA